MADVVEEQISALFSNPESGAEPEEGANLPDKGQVLAPTSVTEDQIAEEAVAAEESAGEQPAVEPKTPADGEPKAVEPSAAAASPAIAPESRVAAARMHQINRLRRQKAKDREEITTLRKELEEVKQAILGTGEDSDALAQEQLNANPALKGIWDRINSLDKVVTQRANAEQEQAHAYQEAEEIHRYAAEAAATFRTHTPDFNDAYYWQRERVARERGIDKWPAQQREQQLNLWEHEFTAAMAEIGEDPAALMYQQAMDAGWRSGMKAGGMPVNGGAERATIAPAVTRRVRDAAPSLSQAGRGGQATGDRISREEFYRRYSKEQRIALFQGSNGEDIFEELDTKGAVSVGLLPR